MRCWRLPALRRRCAVTLVVFIHPEGDVAQEIILLGTRPTRGFVISDDVLHRLRKETGMNRDQFWLSDEQFKGISSQPKREFGAR